MKGDITRSTFDREKHYTGVRMQQGRVLLDSEWNEQVDIAAYLDRIANVDVIGKSGVPRDGGGFAVVMVPGDLIITPGRMWVDGILCESEAGPFAAAAGQGADGVKIDPWPVDLTRYAKGLWLQLDGKKGGNDATSYRRIKSVTSNTKIVTFTSNVDLDSVTRVRPVWSYATQPHDPAPAETGTDGNGDRALTINVDYVAYLDVWERHLTAVEDERIREVALGGPDTTTRTQTIWQVRLDKIAKVCADIVSPVPVSRLAAQTAPVADPPNPCIVPSQAGYRGLANQLYRVEVHTGTAPGPATFKWSRDNGAFVFPVEGSVTGQKLQLRLESLGRDERFGLAANDWVELIDERLELQGLPGFFARVTKTPQQNDRILELDKLPNDTDFQNPAKSLIDLTRNPRVRLWSYDRDQPPPAKGDTPIAAGPINLESGIQVLFSGNDYRTGEYWLIPARTAINEETGDIEWPRFGATPIPLPPRGITHHHAALADVTVATGQVEDCRPLFSPLTAPELFYLSGDGQEVMPDLVTKNRVQLPYPLKVGVLNGGPIANAEVEFEVLDGDGRLANAQKIFKVTTGPSGVAQTTWDLDATTPHQRCRARLLKANGYAPVPLPVIEFNASLSIAAQVAYDPAKCEELKQRNAKTVQAALDAFCDILDDPKLHFVGGDGQETTRTSAAPAELPETIDVGVADGIRPVANQKVRFTPSHNGRINGVAGPVEVNSGGNGLASVKWALDSAGPESQTARAELIVGGNPTGLPVIFKAMFREVGGGVGPCSIVISPGEDVLARIAEVAGDPDIEICFKAGTFNVEQTIVLEGRNSVKVTGAGPRGTRIVSKAKSVFVFRKCTSVLLRDLSVDPGSEGPEVADVAALHFTDCTDAGIDTVRATAPEPPAGFLGAALWFLRTKSFSVERCELRAGSNRAGIVFDEPEQAYIAENDIGSSPLRLILTDKVRALRANETPRAGEFVVDLGNQRVGATVPRELQDDLRRALAGTNNPRINSGRAAVAAFRNTVSNLIFEPSARANFPELDRRIRRFLADEGRALVAILARHEVRGTEISIGSVTIRDNVIHDVRSGIVCGEFRNTFGGDQIERLAVSGNRISFNDESITGIPGLQPATAVFVSECDSLHVFGNHIEAEQSGTFGIRMDGLLGTFAVLRDNHLVRCKTGILGSNLGAIANRTWWAIANNTDVITLPDIFQRDKNVPVP